MPGSGPSVRTVPCEMAEQREAQQAISCVHLRSGRIQRLKGGKKSPEKNPRERPAAKSLSIFSGYSGFKPETLQSFRICIKIVNEQQKPGVIL